MRAPDGRQPWRSTRIARLCRCEGNVHAQQTTHELSADKLLLDLDAAFHARRLSPAAIRNCTIRTRKGRSRSSADEISRR